MMQSLLNLSFITGWLMVPFLWFYILKISKISLWKLTLPSFVVLSIFIFQYIGFPILFFELDDYRVEFVTNKYLIIQAWIITSLTTLLICLGSFVSYVILGRLKYFTIKEQKYQKIITRRVFCVAIICIVVLYNYVTRVGFNNLALVVSLNSSSFDAAQARSLMGNDFGGGYHWYNVFMRDILIFSSLYFFALHWMGHSKKSIITPLVLFGCASFSLIMASEKGLFADYLIVLMLLYILVKNNGVVSLKNILVVIIPIISSLVIFYMIFMGDLSIVAGLSSVFSRALTGSLQPIYHYLEFFPYHRDWLYGASFPNPGGIFPFTPYGLTVEVMNFVVPDHLTTGIVGTMPAIYWGEVYANFGYYGLIFFPLVIGIFLYLLNWIIFRRNFEPLNLALFAWLLVHYKNLSVTGISMFLFDLSLFIVILIYFLLKMKIFTAKNNIYI